jgi:hypothetical protein
LSNEEESKLESDPPSKRAKSFPPPQLEAPPDWCRCWVLPTDYPRLIANRMIKDKDAASWVQTPWSDELRRRYLEYKKAEAVMSLPKTAYYKALRAAQMKYEKSGTLDLKATWKIPYFIHEDLARLAKVWVRAAYE